MSKKNICCVFQSSSSLSTGGLNWFPLKVDLIETQFPFSIFRHFHLHLEFTAKKKREDTQRKSGARHKPFIQMKNSQHQHQSQLKTFIAGILHGIIPASKMASAEKQHICYSFFRYVFKCILSQNVAAVMLGAHVKPWKKGVRKIHHSYRDNTQQKIHSFDFRLLHLFVSDIFSSFSFHNNTSLKKERTKKWLKKITSCICNRRKCINFIKDREEWNLTVFLNHREEPILNAQSHIPL